MKRILFLIFVVSCAWPVQAQKRPSEIIFPALPDFEIPAAKRVTLNNGMTLYLIEDRALPMVSVAARINVGSVYEPSDKVGLAAIVGSVMRSGGTTSVPPDDLNERLENIAASIETGIGETSGSASMFALTEYVPTVLPLFADVLMHPAFPQDKLDLEKTQWKSSISRRNDDPGSIASREFDELMYGSDSPWARTPEYATVDAVMRDDLVAFHQAYFRPENIILGAWGDFDAAEMERRLNAAFRDWKPTAGFVRPVPPPVDGNPDPGVYLVPKGDVTQSTVYLGHRGEIKLDDPDYPAVTLMNEVLSGGFSGRLMKSVRVEQGLAYAVGGGYSAGYDRPGRFFAQVMTKSGSTVDATRAVVHELEKMQAAPPTEAEVSLARDGYLNRFVFNFDSRAEVVGRMMTYDYYGYPADFLQNQKAALEAVTPEDIHRVAQKYLRPEDAKILVVGKPSDFGEPLSALGDVVEIDIAIPTGEEPLPQASDATSEAGRRLLLAAMDAMGGADAMMALAGVSQDGTQSVVTPDGQTFELGLKVLMGFPDRARFDQQTPMGALVITKDGDEWGIPTMIPEQMQGQLKDQIRGSLWQNPLFFLPNAARLEVQQLADAEFEGKTAHVLLISPPEGATSFRLYVDPGTGLPMGISYQRGPTAAREVYGDFRSLGAFSVPYSVTVYEGERRAGEVSYETVALNPTLDDSLFRQ